MTTDSGEVNPDPDALLPRLRVVAFADSLAMPRDNPPDVIRWEETWPRQLSDALARKQLPSEVINCGGRARTIDSLVAVDFVEHFVFKRPDVAILQIGVVDCAPRIFSRREYRMINRSRFPRFLRDRIVARRSERRAEIIRRNPLAKVYTPPERFSMYLREFEEKRQGLINPSEIIVLPIVGNATVMDLKSPGYSDNVARYNEILRSFCSESDAHWITPEELLLKKDAPEMFCTDGHHLNVAGSRRCGELLAEIIAASRFPMQERKCI